MLSRLLARVGLVTPEQRAWAWYDCGNSAYFTTVVTAVFPAFFASYAAAGMPAGEATTRFGLITTIGMAIVAIAAPILGAFGDYTGTPQAAARRLCAASAWPARSRSTTITEGGWQWAALVFVLGNIGVSGSLVFYDSMLPSVATPEETDRVSSAGYALGYLGGGVLLVLNLAWVLQPQLFGLSGTVAAIKLSFASVGVWWLLFMIPLLRHVPEPPRAGRARRAADRRRDSRLVRPAGAHLRRDPPVSPGVPGAAGDARLPGRHPDHHPLRRHLRRRGRRRASRRRSPPSPWCSSSACLSPSSSDRSARRLGTQQAIFLALAVYAVAATLGFFMQNATHFFLLAGLVATVQGGAQALSRSLFARLIPPAKTSEYFGFYAVVERFATILGPLVFTVSGALTGSSRSAVLGMIAFFVAGGWLLSRVDVEEGERIARAG